MDDGRMNNWPWESADAGTWKGKCNRIGVNKGALEEASAMARAASGA
jgi:hypothetical protein